MNFAFYETHCYLATIIYLLSARGVVITVPAVLRLGRQGPPAALSACTVEVTEGLTNQSELPLDRPQKLGTHDTLPLPGTWIDGSRYVCWRCCCWSDVAVGIVADMFNLQSNATKGGNRGLGARLGASRRARGRCLRQVRSHAIGAGNNDHAASGSPFPIGMICNGERLLLQCPNLKNLHTLGCQDKLIGAIRNQYCFFNPFLGPK